MKKRINHVSDQTNSQQPKELHNGRKSQTSYIPTSKPIVKMKPLTSLLKNTSN